MFFIETQLTSIIKEFELTDAMLMSLQVSYRVVDPSFWALRQLNDTTFDRHNFKFNS